MVMGKVFCDQIRVIEWMKNCDFNLSNHFDIWRIHIPDHLELVNIESDFLSAGEIERLNGFKNQEDRNRYFLAHYYVRKLSSRYLNVDPECFELAYKGNEKPYFKSFQDFNFNISHSGDYIIIGFANKWSVGVDIEYMSTQMDLYDLIYNCMSNNEISMILNSDKPRSMFFKQWTRKESLLKGIGLGITDRIREVSCMDGLNLIPYDLSSFALYWKIWSFEMGEYCVSFAHDSSIRIIRFYQL